MGYYGMYTGTLRPPKEYLKQFPFKPPALPVITLGKLAVSETMQHRGLGTLLLEQALAEATVVSRLIGAVGMKLEAYQGSAQFYEKHHFSYVSKNPKWTEPTSVEVMYLPFAVL